MRCTMAVSSFVNIDAHHLHGNGGLKTSTSSPSSFYNLRSRISAFGPLRQLVGIFTFQEQNGPRRPERHDPDAITPSSPVAVSGHSTPRRESPQTLDITAQMHTPAPEYYGAEHMNSNTAEMALRLWLMARDPARCPDVRWQAQARTMQIDAVRYMNMALPHDLSPTEAATIRASIPQEILSNQPSDYQHYRPTALRKVVARIVALLIALFVFVVPLSMSLASTVLGYERDHRIAERVFASARKTFEGLFRYRTCLQAIIAHLLTSPMGRSVITFGSYLVDGVSGGVLDGCCGYREAPADARGVSLTGPKIMVGFPLQVGRGPCQ